LTAAAASSTVLTAGGGDAAPGETLADAIAGAEKAAIEAAAQESRQEAFARGPKDPVAARLPRLLVDKAPREGARAGDPAIDAALLVLDGLSPAIRRRVARVDVDPALQVDLRLNDGLRLRMGAAERLRAKLLALRAVLEVYRARGQRPTVVDLSVPQRPLAAPLLKS
jgi:hypothetical protein